MNEETQTLSTPFNAFDNGVAAADVRQREPSNTVAPDRQTRFASSRRDTEYIFDAMQKKNSILKPFLPSQKCELTRSPSRLIHSESHTYLHIKIEIKIQNPKPRNTTEDFSVLWNRGSWIELQIFN